MVKYKQNTTNNQTKYITTLKECSEIAIQEYQEANNKLKELKEELTSYQNTLVEAILKLNNSSIKDRSIYEPLDTVNKKTSELLRKGFDDFEKSFTRKSKSLSYFTVTLFGKTKAGKSTIREALTNGDGSTIGKGAQRTTRDVITYQWNHIRIIDTPGFDAYQGEEDEKIAFSQVDETDLILFLVTSDSIEESEFIKLARLRRENKPVIILLNVLYDIKHPIKRKLFLQNPRKYVSIDAIRGHLSRLKFLSKKHFEIKNIPVIPIHALCAFEANKATGEQKEKLYVASNFDYFKKFLINEIETSGKQKRVHTFRDSYIFHLENDIKPVYVNSYKNLKPIVNLLYNKQKELNNWFNKFIPDKNKEIEIEVKRIFTPLFNQLDFFVEQNIEDENFSEKWKKLVNEHITDDKIKCIQEKIISDMNRYLDEFFKEFKFDMNISVSKIQAEINRIKKSSVGKVLRWAEAATGLLSAIAFLNSWNPLGWGLGIIAFGMGIFSWFWGDDTKRFNKQKAKLKTRMFNNLEKMQRKNISALKTWFYNEITRGLKRKITQDLYNQVILFKKLLKEYSIIIDKIDSIIEKENIDLIKRLLELDSSHTYNFDVIKKVGRVQGIVTKILVKEPLFKDKEDAKNFMKIYGERIIEIVDESNKLNLLVKTLNTNFSDIINVNYIEKIKGYIIKVRKDKLGNIIGIKGQNIKTAEKILNHKIIIKEGVN